MVGPTQGSKERFLFGADIKLRPKEKKEAAVPNKKGSLPGRGNQFCNNIRENNLGYVLKSEARGLGQEQNETRLKRQVKARVGPGLEVMGDFQQDRTQKWLLP